MAYKTTYIGSLLRSVGVCSVSDMGFWKPCAGICDEVAVNQLLAFFPKSLLNTGGRWSSCYLRFTDDCCASREFQSLSEMRGFRLFGRSEEHTSELQSLRHLG